MFKKILIGVLFLIIGLFTYAYFLPPEYLIYREISINAKAETIFPLIVNTKMADEWMPWKELDPNVKITYSGPDGAIGSTANWESDGQMGVGKSEVVDVVPNQKVTTKITYFKPMEFTQISEFSLTQKNEGTVMRWTVSGNKTFISRLMCIFMDLDKYLGGEFENGLRKLKEIVESKRQ